MLSDEDRRATERLAVRPVVSQVVRAIRPLMPGVKFDLSGTLDDFRFPIGSFAEWNAVLQNVLTNAWNAMLDSEEAIVSIDAGRERGRRAREWLRVSDTGIGWASRWKNHRTCSSPSRRPPGDQRHEQIHRDRRSRAGACDRTNDRAAAEADVAFVTPREQFSTTFEISWRGATR